MTAHVPRLRLLLVFLAEWINRYQEHVIEYFVEENSVLREQLKGHALRLKDDQRRRLAAKGHRLGRELLSRRCPVNPRLGCSDAAAEYSGQGIDVRINQKSLGVCSHDRQVLEGGATAGHWRRAGWWPSPFLPGILSSSRRRQAQPLEQFMKLVSKKLSRI